MTQSSIYDTALLRLFPAFLRTDQTQIRETSFLGNLSASVSKIASNTFVSSVFSTAFGASLFPFVMKAINPAITAQKAMSIGASIGFIHGVGYPANHLSGLEMLRSNSPKQILSSLTVAKLISLSLAYFCNEQYIIPNLIKSTVITTSALLSIRACKDKALQTHAITAIATAIFLMSTDASWSSLNTLCGTIGAILNNRLLNQMSTDAP
jgi:hypothetical protein